MFRIFLDRPVSSSVRHTVFIRFNRHVVGDDILHRPTLQRRLHLRHPVAVGLVRLCSVSQSPLIVTSRRDISWTTTATNPAAAAASIVTAALWQRLTSNCCRNRLIAATPACRRSTRTAARKTPTDFSCSTAPSTYFWNASPARETAG